MKAKGFDWVNWPKSASSETKAVHYMHKQDVIAEDTRAIAAELKLQIDQRGMGAQILSSDYF